MGKTFVSDYFELMIQNNSRESKLKLYKIVIDSGMELMEHVHERVVGELRNRQRLDAMILFQMAIWKGVTISNLIDGVSYFDKPKGRQSQKIIDPTSLAALTRIQMENFSILHNVYNSSTDQNVVDLLYDIWVIAGLTERQKASTLDTNFEEKKKKEAKEIEVLRKKIRANSIFQSQTPTHQKKILEWISKRKFELVYRKGKIILLPQRDLFLSSGVRDTFSNQYGFLSWYIHPSNVSVFQFAQMFNDGSNEQSAYTLLNVSRIMMSMLIVEYCKYIPFAMDQFGSLPKLNQAIIYSDNRTYRAEDDFPSQIFAEVESELQKILQKRDK